MLARDSLVLRALPARAHLHQFRIEPAQDVDQISLRGHDRVDVFVNSGNFIESCAQQGDVALSEHVRLRMGLVLWRAVTGVFPPENMLIGSVTS